MRSLLKKLFVYNNSICELFLRLVINIIKKFYCILYTLIYFDKWSNITDFNFYRTLRNNKIL
jgi:hypothetical protein